jgi:NAD(P)H-hydrate epimerase
MCHDALNQDKISSLIAKADIIGIGPGLGTDDWAVDLFNLAMKSDKYLVLDADALNILSSNPIKRGNWTLTPHPGEAARLIDTSVSDIQKDRLASIFKLTERYSANVLLKGRYSLIHNSINEHPFMITTGNPGMATAGMGDLLTGVTCSLLGQFGTEYAAKITSIAAHLHSKSGDLASHKGERGMIASDLLPYIRKLVNP